VRPEADFATPVTVVAATALRQHNELLTAAGFAPVWRETDFAAPQFGRMREALGFILTQQEPFPAVVVDRR
jgi:hypothetical protein